MKCISCHRRIANDSNYCRICGKRQVPGESDLYLDSDEDMSYIAPDDSDIPEDVSWIYEQDSTEDASSNQTKPKKKKWPLILGCAVLACALLVFGIIKLTAPPAWEGNLLKESTLRFDTAANIEECYGLTFRAYISTVTFQDDLSGMPENARDVSQHGNGTVMAWVVQNGDDYHLYIAAEGGINGAVACKGLFSNYTALKEINFNGAFHTDYAKSMQGMFLNCNDLLSLNARELDTSNVTNMESMFGECKSLVNLDLSSFHTENVVDFTSMFASCFRLETLILGDFDTSSASNMRYMFFDCHSLTDLDVSSFDTSNVHDMTKMFCDCSAPVDASGFDITYVSYYLHEDFMKNCNGISPFDN